MPRFLIDIAVIVEATDHIEARNALIRVIGAQAYLKPVTFETFVEVRVSPLAPLLDHAFTNVEPGFLWCTTQVSGRRCGALRQFHR